MSRQHDTFWCDGCGVEILWAPVKVGECDYCCEDCREGRPCECGDRMEEEERRAQSAAAGAL